MIEQNEITRLANIRADEILENAEIRHSRS